jgi:hypothetical protein
MAGVHCTSSVFADEMCQMLKIIQCFGKHGSCHIQGESLIWGGILEVVGGQLGLMVLISGIRVEQPALLLH